LALGAIVCLGACEAAKSANPTAPSVAGPIPGVSISAPVPLLPSAGATLYFSADPQTLLIENAGTSGVRPITLEIDVATDASFTQIVHHADNVAPGDNGRTEYRLPAPLPAGFTYYWRIKANDGANSGPYSAAATFQVVPPVRIDAPIATSPSGKLSTNQPDFRVTNGEISGTTGVAYRFEVSRTPDFSQLVAIVQVPVGAGSTTMTMGVLPYETTFYWRVRGSDGGTESNYSNTLAFTTSDQPQQAPDPTTGPIHADSAAWTTDQWEDFVMDLARRVGGPTVSDAGMHAMRGELLAHGSDFQNGWRGDLRPRIFLPVPGCPIANRPDVPLCSYNRTVDLGSYGRPWEWIPRF
jgi:hypothetical protein